MDSKNIFFNIKHSKTTLGGKILKYMILGNYL